MKTQFYCHLNYSESIPGISWSREALKRKNPLRATLLSLFCRMNNYTRSFEHNGLVVWAFFKKAEATPLPPSETGGEGLQEVLHFTEW